MVGSHVGQTSRQLTVLRAQSDVTGIELSVPGILSGAADLPARTAQQVRDALSRSDVLLYTSRAVAAGGSARHSLQIARAVSAAVASTVRETLPARPAWVLAKGGITAHDVALHGLRIRRAEVAGQLFPGMISVLSPVAAPPEALGVPYVVFAGNVGDDATLAQVVAILNELA
ncbi:MAG TPA: nucleotide-binding domain containing protein [Streptosporangiaceae bacterium]|nr:nucleotide-binding domain containing protein [Streptosporangiaceae bacterium]